MYGKIFSSTFTGSMMSAGADVFAVWSYVIANTHFARIELNPKLVGCIIGMSEERAENAIDYLCSPDERSRSKAEDGKRLIKEGEYQYLVVNHEAYRKMRDETGRREYNALKQRESRARKAERKAAAKTEEQSPKQEQENNSNSINAGMSNVSARMSAQPEPEPRLFTSFKALKSAAPLTTSTVPNSARAAETAVRALSPGQACMAMRAAGMADANPANPKVQQAIDAGAKVELFAEIARETVASGKGFGYALATILGRIEDAKRKPSAKHARYAGAMKVLYGGESDAGIDITGESKRLA